jgi:hypothetical protein
MGLKEQHDPIDDYENLHEGETIYVLGSGATLDYLTPDFFDDKLTIAVNFVGSVFGLKGYYCFSHYHEDAQHEAKREDCIGAFTPEREHGTDGVFAGCAGNLTTFGSRTGRPGSTFDPHDKDWPVLSGQLTIGSSSIHGAMHLAAHMGAKFIVLVGADCGSLGGRDRVDGYVQGESHWALYEMHLRAMKQRLWDVYSCQVYSLNPFVNYSLEGVQYRGAASIN